MAKKAKSETSAELPGLTLERFGSAVRAVAGLRDAGKVQLFLKRSGAITVIGDLEDFRSALSEQTRQDETAEAASEALGEVETYCTLALEGKTVLSGLLRAQLSRDTRAGQLTTHQRQEFVKREGEKTRVASSQLVTNALRRRLDRVATATAPCIDDVEVEFVTERHMPAVPFILREPFLRLRLRYTHGRTIEASLGALDILGEALSPSSPGSFEVECDASDIDMLIFRLSAAKQLLLKADEPSAGPSDTTATEES